MTSAKGEQTDTHAMTTNPRRRATYALMILVVIASGLASRSPRAGLPPLPAKAAGDALWALMFFLAFGFLRPEAPTLPLALFTLAFAFAVEFSQLYRAPWIDAVRSTTAGGLFLGHGFHATDLLWYTLGVLPGAAGEWFLLKPRPRAG